MRYARDEFQEVTDRPGVFYCPGCNSCPEDAELPSLDCPCERFGTGGGSLPRLGMMMYLTQPRGE